MNPFTRKIVASIFAAILGMNIILPITAADGRCVTHTCCCSDMVTANHHGMPTTGYFAENGCCSCTGKIPCNLNEMNEYVAPVSAVSSVRVDRRTDIHTEVAVTGPSLVQTFKGIGTTRRFRMTTDPIPIHIKNLTLII